MLCENRGGEYLLFVPKLGGSSEKLGGVSERLDDEKDPVCAAAALALGSPSLPWNAVLPRCALFWPSVPPLLAPFFPTASSTSLNIERIARQRSHWNPWTWLIS